MKKLLPLIVALLVPALAFAEDTPQVPIRRDLDALQYMQSCMPGPAYSMKFSGANRAKVLKAPDASSYAASTWVRLDWGTQWKVACDNAGVVLACLHQTLAATVSLGISATGGDGAGLINFDSANTSSGPGRCLPLTAVNPMDVFKVSKASFKCDPAASSRDPTTRCGQCTVAGTAHTVGDPCASSSDCGSGGTCSTTTRPKGVYLSLVPTVATSVCWVTRCDQ